MDGSPINFTAGTGHFVSTTRALHPRERSTDMPRSEEIRKLPPKGEAIERIGPEGPQNRKRRRIFAVEAEAIRALLWSNRSLLTSPTH
jgi:hypothetical protein